MMELVCVINMLCLWFLCFKGIMNRLYIIKGKLVKMVRICINGN